ncbi:hypothetical protein SAMN04488688_105309 [Paenibacillus sp. cl141a]|uniref:hypothetical protein n=1 Tax=Paenibacillus sp. cl141a TaxID=1761877 RepID=UPI0008BADA72|nr:hypothetical protein [Paenibacillus sp. cl141a]SEL73000.1 hypothetical protein SAMN04488688_105309 [Paenibacillus sp. cl141a]
MESLGFSKRNARLVVAWQIMIVMVGVLLLSGCAEFSAFRANMQIEERSIGGAASESNRDSSIAPASFIGQIWGDLSEGVSNRARIMTGRQTQSRSVTDSAWRMNIR